MTLPLNMLRRIVENIILHTETNNFIKANLITELNEFTRESHKYIISMNLKITKLENDIMKLENMNKKHY